ncbi:hypothetical protein B0I35DRAFT_451778 [Stachybotrys elegans]|uniref:EKC/KEOPS complex subunit BUD32 n=1 Tax=Stachybotrys elegans TaxID=80388 RepID=A0A8K0SQL5_9HYPO|nr:hypothetical protein B0I35DRAFT_451778 [Stachybotrys elegans]
MDEELEEADPALEHLAKHVDNLAPDVVAIHVSPEGALISTSTRPEDDETFCPWYPPLGTIERPDGIGTILRSDLEELDRLGPMVDLVTPLRAPEPRKKLVFKYFFVEQRLRFTWEDANIWMRLPKHPNIVPFDKIVVDEIEGAFVGFTVAYITGGTLEDNQSREFKLKWLTQLISVVDDLNLNLGISHQDVAPRNLVVDDSTDSLMIFDFNFSAHIGEPEYDESRNDVKGVFFTLYEIITRDDTLRSVQHEQQNLSDLDKDWIKHPDVRLDRPVSEFRQVLQEWLETRKTGRQVAMYTEAPNFINWPTVPEPAPSEVIYESENGPITKMVVRQSFRRTKLVKQGKPVLSWERPAQSKLKPGQRLLETGEYIQES